VSLQRPRLQVALDESMCMLSTLSRLIMCTIHGAQGCLRFMKERSSICDEVCLQLDIYLGANIGWHVANCKPKHCLIAQRIGLETLKPRLELRCLDSRFMPVYPSCSVLALQKTANKPSWCSQHPCSKGVPSRSINRRLVTLRSSAQGGRHACKEGFAT